MTVRFACGELGRSNTKPPVLNVARRRRIAEAVMLSIQLRSRTDDLILTWSNRLSRQREPGLARRGEIGAPGVWARRCSLNSTVKYAPS